jgi:hypothetical protein
MPESFYKRFPIEVPSDEASRQFINRAHHIIFDELYYSLTESERSDVDRWVLIALGDRLRPMDSLGDHVSQSFSKTLRAIEAMWLCFPPNSRRSDEFDRALDWVLQSGDLDAGVRWIGGAFYPAGAKELDNALINQALEWIADERYLEVRKAFQKALHHLMASASRPELRKDVITDAYEALESLAKIVTGKERDLSGNAELFISRIKAPIELLGLLKEFVVFGCEYRHGVMSRRSTPSEADVEMYLYLTGALVRRAIQSVPQSSAPALTVVEAGKLPSAAKD